MRELAAAIVGEPQHVEEAPASAIERVVPLALARLVKVRIEQFLHTDVLGVDQFARAVHRGPADIDAAVTIESCRSEEFGGTFRQPARHGLAQG